MANGFDKNAFIGAYTDAAGAQADAIGGAFETIERRLDGMEQRFDARFDRIERVLEKAFPEAYAAVNGG